MFSPVWILSILTANTPAALAFHVGSRARTTKSNIALSVKKGDGDGQISVKPLMTVPVQLMLAATLALGSPVNAYDESDYASEAVTEAIQELNDAAGNTAKSFTAFEDIAKIITEGKGIGGNVNYQGVNLERGLVAGEDTSIYNPGLTLLTESEKERLVEAVIMNKQKALSTKTWDDNNQYAFEFLKQKLDPLHTYELKPYLSIFPVYAAVVYLFALFVQQNLRSLFTPAYIACALAVFGPAIVLIATGP